MDPDSSFNNSGVSSTPSRPTYNNGAGYQNNNQVSQRPNEAQRDMTPNFNQEGTKPTTTSVATTQTDWVRFNTICNKELVDKVRAIADRNHSSIRDVVELMFRAPLLHLYHFTQ